MVNSGRFPDDSPGLLRVQPVHPAMLISDNWSSTSTADHQCLRPPGAPEAQPWRQRRDSQGRSGV